MNTILLQKMPLNMRNICLIEEARREAGYRNGYGQYVAAGCPKKEDYTRQMSSGARKCPECQKSFYPARHNQKYCSAACADKHQTEANREKQRQRDAAKRAAREAPEMREVECGICHKIFLRPKNNVNYQYCSKECQYQAFVERSRKANKKHRAKEREEREKRNG